MQQHGHDIRVLLLDTQLAKRTATPLFALGNLDMILLAVARP